MRKLLVATATAVTLALTAAPAAAGDREDRTIARRAVLRVSDVPADWESEPGDTDADETGLAECRAIDRAARSAEQAPHVDSPNFSDPADPLGITQVENSVYVFPSAKAAKKVFAAFASDEALDCLSAIGDASVAGMDNTVVEVSVLDVGGAGDDAVGYTLEISGTNGEGESFSATTDIVAVRVGRGFTGFTAQNPEGPLPFGPDILETVVGRLERAL